MPPSRLRPEYDPELRQAAADCARLQGLVVREGVYAAVTGPNYETRAEYRMLRKLGADVVGMSTVPELAAACNSGVAVLGLSAVTNVANPDTVQSTDHDEVLDWASIAAPKMLAVIRGLLENNQ